MHKKRVMKLLVLALAFSMVLAGSLYAGLKGKLYLMNGRQTLSPRAGVPCVEGEKNFCQKNFACKPGHVAKGLVMNLTDHEGTMSPSGFGVACADPNEVYNSYETGALGKNFSGKVYRDPCDVGFFLAGVRFFTNDREQISGVQPLCRRYWPVEERWSVNTFGEGMEKTDIICPEGKFVTGIKSSYWRDTEKASMETGIISLRFYCAEMRHYKGVPEDEQDPRSEK